MRSSFLFLLSLFLASNEHQIHAQDYSVLTSFLEFLQRGQSERQLQEQSEPAQLHKEYDFIVVGAGTAGCTLAARLSENPKWRVLLLEAGGPENLVMDVPIVTHLLQLGDINWKYRTQPSDHACLAMNQHRCNWPRGKVMGGSSVLNYMMYTRGNRRDYDRWAALGNEGWSYRDVLPYFKKYEGSSVPDAEAAYVGRDGPVKISYVKWRTALADAFVLAAQQNGLKRRDYNGRIQTGVSYLQTTTYHETRWSANRAYLYPLKGKRQNLHVRKHAMVTQILLEGNNETGASAAAYGVRFIVSGGKGDVAFEVRARREVIISAGAINTPQLLMLSGIGPAAHLRAMGIEPYVDLAVGYNLQDHIATSVSFSTNASSMTLKQMFDTKSFADFVSGHKGAFGSTGGCEALAFWNLEQEDRQDREKEEDSWPDIELFLMSGSMRMNPAIFRAFGFQQSLYNTMFVNTSDADRDGFMIFPMILQPKSRGRIMLRNKDPGQKPLIYANYFAHPYDIDILVRGVLKAIDLTQERAFQRVNAQLAKAVLPACQQHAQRSRAYWECFVRYFTLTIYHYAGTAKMGPASDPTAVVDARLRVHGVQRLRVADASIMPYLIAGHPNGPIFMIAEKAADMIKQDHGYEPRRAGKGT